MGFDLVRLAMIQACQRYRAGGDLFCAAGFGLALKRIAGLEGVIDGHLVRAILCGRGDVEILSGNSMFRMLSEDTPDA